MDGAAQPRCGWIAAVAKCGDGRGASENGDRRGPLDGIRVVEFSHMVMGPSIGVILADLGADVVKVEPIGGDDTRRLLGSGAGYFPMFNRNKRSICLDLKSADGLAIAHALVDRADDMIENYRPGTIARLGLAPEGFATSNPGLVSRKRSSPRSGSGTASRRWTPTPI